MAVDPERPAAERMPTREELQAHLLDYNEHPQRRERVLAEVDERFRRTAAVVVVDTCGFSRTVREKGIVHFLALLERLERLMRPSIEREGGRILRREADNVFAVFDGPDRAVAAARAIQHDVGAANEALPAEEEVGVSIGVGYGDLLLVGNDDAWGEEMNLASKLGEDLAECGEILITPAAREGLSRGGAELEERRYSVSGLELVAYRCLEG